MYVLAAVEVSVVATVVVAVVVVVVVAVDDSEATIKDEHSNDPHSSKCFFIPFSLMVYLSPQFPYYGNCEK